jgi:DNA invertase Pin-like site-specific DNA recombinase
MIAIGYTRRSKKGDETTVSLETQKEQIGHYCDRLGFDLKHVLTDDGVSGRKRARFARLDEAVKRWAPNYVVVYQLDRMARDAAGLADYLQSLTARGIELHEAAGVGPIDTKKAINRMMTGIRGVTDQFYAELIGEKTADALAHLKSRGLQYTRVPPLGYRYDEGRLIEDPEEQRGLFILLQCAKAGLGARRALAVLQDQKYTGRQSLKAIFNALKRGTQ